MVWEQIQTSMQEATHTRVDWDHITNNQKISYKISQTNKLVSKALTCDGSVFDTEKLGFVVSVDGWVGVGVSWEEWKLVWEIICHQNHGVR